MSGQVFHAPFLHVHKGFKFYAVWERTKNKAAAQYPSVKSCRTLEEILADPQVELVIVNTPNVTHFDYARRALEAGKHVIVEKPFTATVQQAQALMQLSAKQNKLLSVFHNRRWDSDFKTVKKVIEKGWLGELIEVEFHFDRFKEELSPKLHKELPGEGTGVLYDLGSHLIDQALHLFGMPSSIFADIRITRPASLVDDCFDIFLYYDQLRLRLHSGYLVREPLPSYILHGSRGSFLKPRADIQEAELIKGTIPGSQGWGMEPDEQRGLLHTEINAEVIIELIPTETGNYMEFFEGIYQSIRNGAPLPVTAGEGMQVIKIIEAAVKSNEEKRLVDL
jgi:predicted dehydrogenase